MQITMRNVVEGIGALRMLSMNKLPFKVSYKIGRQLQDLEREAKEHDRLAKEIRDKHRIDEHTVNASAYQIEYQEMLDMKIEIWGDPILVSDIETSLQSVEPAVLFALMDWLLVDEIPKAKEASA